MKITSTFLQFLFIIFLLNIPVKGQSAGDFQSYQTGNWNDVTTWEWYSGTMWANPAPYTPTYSDGVITILNGHTVTITASVSVNQTVVDAGGTLTISSGSSGKLRFNDGTGYELTINGTLINNYDISSASVDIIFSSGSTYQHNINYQNVPIATWDANSNVEITGVTSHKPSYLNQSFGNFTWNCSSQTADLSFGSGFHTFGGNFTIASTGSGTVHFTSGEATTVTIGGNFVMTGGTLQFAYSGYDRQMNVAGDYTISGGRLELGGESGSKVGTLNIDGNFSHTAGTITETGSGSGEIVFSGSGTHTYTSGGTISNTINFTVNSGSTLQMASASTTITGGGSFTLSSGSTLGITSSDGITTSGASGNIQVTGTRTYSTGANYTYNGTVSQNMGNGFPANLTGTLTLNNPDNTVTLDNARTFANGGSIILNAGTFAVGNNCTMSSTCSITGSGGDMTGTLQGSGTYNLTYTGNSKTTGSELGGSGLNNFTVNLNSGQTLTLDQSRTVAGTLTMTSGDINTGVNTLTLGTSTSSLGSLSRSSGTIIGNFQRWFAASTVSDVLFPIGTASNYRPANITFTVAPSTGGTLTTFFTASDPGTTGLPLDDSGTSIVNAGKEGYWNINAADGLTGGTYSLDLTADGFSGVSAVSSLRLLKRSTGGSWTLDGLYLAGTGTTSTPIVHRTGMTGFSEFGIGGASDNPLPVELTSFLAEVREKTVVLKWKTETEVNNYGFEIERKVSSKQLAVGNWEKIGFVEGYGNSNSLKEYTFIDDNITTGKYSYRLKQIDNDGNFEYSKIIEVDLGSPGKFELSQNYPNPFNPSTTISYSIPNSEKVSLKVFDVLGNEVAELVNEKKPAGYYEVNFDAGNLSSGIYFYKLQVGDDFVKTKKMLLIR